jgi:chromosome segregation ATPase
MTDIVAKTDAMPTKLWQEVLSDQVELEPRSGDTRLVPDFMDLVKITEDVRSRSMNVINRANDLTLLRDEFVDIFNNMGKILDESEKKGSILIDKTALLARRDEEHKHLKGRYEALSAERDQYSHDNALLRGQVERFNTMVSGREARINELEADLKKGREEAVVVRSDLERMRAAHTSSESKLQDAREQLHRQEAAISEYVAQLTELTDRCSLSEFQTTALEKRLIDSQSTVNGLRDSLANAERRNEEATQRLVQANDQILTLQGKITAAEAAIAAAKVASNVSENLSLEREQSIRDDLDRLNKVLSVEQSRAEASESQLSVSRAELQETAAQLRAKNREVEQLVAKCAPLEERLDAALKEITALNEHVANGEKSRSTLADKAQAMIRAMSDLKAKLELADQRAKQLEDRLASNTVLASTDREQFERKIHALNEELEKERSAHRVASSALEAARGKLANYRSSSSLHDAFNQVERLSPKDSPLANSSIHTPEARRNIGWSSLSEGHEPTKPAPSSTQPLISKLDAFPRKAASQEGR